MHIFVLPYIVSFGIKVACLARVCLAPRSYTETSSLDFVILISSNVSKAASPMRVHSAPRACKKPGSLDSSLILLSNLTKAISP
jgi:hypothetical protein